MRDEVLFVIGMVLILVMTVYSWYSYTSRWAEINTKLDRIERLIENGSM